MRKLTCIFLSFFAFCIYINAQSSIVDDLNLNKPGQGKVTVYQDDAIETLIGKAVVSGSSEDEVLGNQLNTTSDDTNTGVNTSTSQNFVKAKGYRIQVYSGSDQKRSKNEAQSRKNTIQSSFPNMEVNVSYNSPVWRVKAGNFKTKEQANLALTEMKAKFPGFGREMYIINDVVKIPVD